MTARQMATSAPHTQKKNTKKALITHQKMCNFGGK